MLSGGQEDGLGGSGGISLDRPEGAVMGQAANTLSRVDPRACMFGSAQQCGIEGAAGQPQGRERQGGLGDVVAGDDPNLMDHGSAKRQGVYAERLDLADRIVAEEIAADLIDRTGSALKQHGAMTGAGQGDGGGSAGRAGADDYSVLTHRRNGMCQVMAA